MEALPDPGRAQNNIEAFLSENPDYASKLDLNRPRISMLFSYSQFLANYCIANPEALFSALQNLDTVLTAQGLRSGLRGALGKGSSLEDGMRIFRVFKKEKMLVLTLRDILKLAGPEEIMSGLSMLADAVLAEALLFLEPFLRQRYGVPENNSLSVIGLGKLGAGELNYSSDVDLIFVFREEGETTGVSTPQGGTINRMSAFEYYSKLIEEYARFLSANTEDGFVYRVDMRLRPQGQRGSLVLPLRSYEEYYESWGQLWEKAALLRARPVAGDTELGNDFLGMIKPFIYRKYIDFHAIEELRRMKAQVERIKPGTVSRDIKRGFGGIREIEFFIQIFQLIYGGKEPLLREKGTLKALHRLLQKGFIGHEDFQHLAGSYIFLRTLEHRLQQLNDLQTHSLPSSPGELEVLGRKMGYAGREDFLSDLHNRRLGIRAIYDSLLYYDETGKAVGPAEHPGVFSAEYWDVDAPAEHLLSERLSDMGLRDIHKAIRCLTKIRNNIYSFQTIRGRRLLEDLVPEFVSEALKGANPDNALLQLVDFSVILATKESYLEAIAQRREIISTLNFIFSSSEYLSRILMSSPEYLGSLVEGEVTKKSLRTLMGELGHLIGRHGELAAIRLFRRLEEVRLGILFLNKKIPAAGLTDALSKTADAALAALLRSLSPPPRPGDTEQRGLGIVCFGKWGGRELSFGSDLDLVFVTLEHPEEDEIRAAERLMNISMSYTKDGAAYKIDTRLRPEGSKGPLVSSIKGLADYYSRDARGWELMALLKARPVHQSMHTSSLLLPAFFMEMRREILMKRGREVTLSEIRAMRERIQKELSREKRGYYDIKLGPGGIGEIEFAVQYLQLKHCRGNPDLLVQGTLQAVKRLNRKGILKDAEASSLSGIYAFYRTIETFIRLRNEPVLRTGGDTARSLADFVGADMDGLMSGLDERKQWVRSFWEGV